MKESVSMKVGIMKAWGNVGSPDPKSSAFSDQETFHFQLTLLELERLGLFGTYVYALVQVKWRVRLFDRAPLGGFPFVKVWVVMRLFRSAVSELKVSFRLSGFPTCSTVLLDSLRSSSTTGVPRSLSPCRSHNPLDN